VPPPPPGFGTDISGPPTSTASDAFASLGDLPQGPPAQPGFSPGDFQGADAIGGASMPPAAQPMEGASMKEGAIPAPPITPDFFARAGRRRH